MATVVGILDKISWSSSTDVIVIADPAKRRLTWVPRDLWCPSLSRRVNRAFSIGGTALLIEALQELGFQCDHALVVHRHATMRAAEQLSVDVPVSEPLNFDYPLEPTMRMQEGSKTVSFQPPFEKLKGERIHQWVGARRGQGRWATDFGRIHRQQIFLRALINQGFDFSSVIGDKTLVRLSSPDAIDELRLVDAGWDTDCFNHVRPETIDGKMVLVKDAHEWSESIQRQCQLELAAVVLARGAPRKVIKTIKSLLDQETAVRIVVVNAGSGPIGRVLARHGIDVGVVECAERLSEHDAQAMGFRSTRAPYVAFVQAGFIAHPGWAKCRLEAHHAGEAMVGNEPTNEPQTARSEWTKRFVGWLSRRGWTTKHHQRSTVSYRRDLVEMQGPSNQA